MSPHCMGTRVSQPQDRPCSEALKVCFFLARTVASMAKETPPLFFLDSFQKESFFWFKFHQVQVIKLQLEGRLLGARREAYS